MALAAYIARRFLFLVPVLAGASLLTFLLVHFTPTSPVELMLGPNATPEQVRELYQELGLDRPFLEQYGRFVVRAFTGDFGISLKTGRPVWQDIRQRMAATVELAVAAFLLVVVVGIVTGVLSALRPNGLLDHLTRVLALLGVATPIFWLGLLLQLLFFSKLQILPLSGRADFLMLLDRGPRHVTGLLTIDTLLAGQWVMLGSVLLHLVLPAVTLAYRSLALVARMVRSSLLEVLNQDYIRTATAFGHSRRRVVARYALPNALLPALTVLGFEFGKLLGGTFLVESVFDWPGMGLYALEAIANADFPAILGVSMILTALYVLINLVVDLGYAWLDPRIRYD